MFLNTSIVWIALLGLNMAAAAENPLVVMNFPPPLIQNTKTRFEPGEDVKFRWTSTYPWISLELYQVTPDRGEWAMVPILTNTSNSTTFYMWTAQELPGMSLEDPFHLRLFNADDPDCRHCHSNSSDFSIIESLAAKEHNLRLGVGLGVGLGMPILVGLTVLATWLWARKRRRVARDNGSQTGEPLVDWTGDKSSISHCEGLGPKEHRREVLEADASLAKVEIQSRDLVELPVDAISVEAPIRSAMEERVELEGDSRRG